MYALTEDTMSSVPCDIAHKHNWDYILCSSRKYPYPTTEGISLKPPPPLKTPEFPIFEHKNNPPPITTEFP